MARTIEGFGIGLREPLEEEILRSGEVGIDWLEITPENHIARGPHADRTLAALAERYPMVLHGVSLSLGGVDPLDGEYLDAVARLARAIDAPFWSDHLCFTAWRGVQAHDLLPLPACDEAIELVARRASQARERVGRPLALENVSSYVRMPGGALDEASFVRRAIEASACGLLLDVNNVLVNANNFGFDAEAYIDAMPIERVVQLHVAGHTRQDELLIDTHRGPTPDAVWALYRRVIARAGRIVPTLVEWDLDIPPLAVVVAELARARREASVALAGARPLARDTSRGAPRTSASGAASSGLVRSAIDALAAVVEENVSVEAMAERLDVPTRRLAVQTQNGARVRREALQGLFAVTRRALGADAFDVLAREYLRATPMRAYVLGPDFVPFAAWLEARGDVPAWIGELARFETEEWATERRARAAHDDAPDEGSLRPCSTLVLRTFAHDLVRWLDDDGAVGAPALRSSTCAFWQDRDARGCRNVLGPVELAALRDPHAAPAEVVAALRAADLLLGAP